MSHLVLINAHQAADVLKEFPSTSLVEKLKTQDQQDLYENICGHQHLVSLLWKSRLSGLPDPLAPFVKSGEMPKAIYELIWLRVEYFWQMWGLCQLTYPSLAEGLRCFLAKSELDFPPEFLSPLTLFRMLVMEETDNWVNCSFEYVEVSAAKAYKIFRIHAKKAQGKTITPQEQKILNNLSKPFKRSVMLALVFSEAEKLARRDKVAKSILTKARVSLSELSSHRATLWESSRSYAWNNGKLLSANPYGGTYS